MHHFFTIILLFLPLLTLSAPIIDVTPTSSESLSIKNLPPPFVAKLTTYNSNTAQCGGAIFPYNKMLFFITAGHCLLDPSRSYNPKWIANNLLVIANDSATITTVHHLPFRVLDSAVFDSKIQDIATKNPMDYTPPKNDIGILLLGPALNYVNSTRLRYLDFIKHLNQYSYEFPAPPQIYPSIRKLSIVSWGVEKELPQIKLQPEFAKKASVEFVDSSVCHNYLMRNNAPKDYLQRFQIDSKTEACVKGDGVFTCIGDSGSVLFHKTNRVVNLVALVSNGASAKGDGCRSGYKRATLIQPYYSILIKPFLDKN